MSDCNYYENLTGNTGNCKSDPRQYVDGKWQYPVVENTCHCRFYDDGKPIIEITPVEFPEKRIVSEDVKIPAQSKREKVLAQKKAEQNKSK